MNETQRAIEHFLSAPAFAVVGASDDLRKFGARVFACYRKHGRIAYPVNPGREHMQGEPCYATLRDLPERVRAASVITPPAVTGTAVRYP